MPTSNDLDQLREELQRKEQVEKEAEQDRLTRAAREYYQSRLSNTPVAMMKLVKKYNISYFKLRTLLGKTQPTKNKEN